MGCPVVDAVTLAQFAVNGLALGSIIALSAVGLTLVYGILNLSNFSHGDLLTAGAYFALLFLVAGLGRPALATAVVLAIALAAFVAIDRAKLRTLGRVERGLLAFGALLLLALGAGTLYAPAPFALRAGVPLALAAATALAAWRMPGRRQDAVLVGGAATAAAAAWMWSGPVVLAVALSMICVGALAVGFEVALWRPLRRGRLSLGSHVLLGGFLGLVVGLAVAASIDALSAHRWKTAFAFAALGAVVARRLLGDRPIARANLVTYVIASIGVALVIRHGLILYFTGELRSFPLEVSTTEPILGLRILEYQRVTFIVAGLSLLGLHLLLRHSKFGKAVRALADNMELARVTGIDVDRTLVHVWFLAGALTALAGILLALTVGTFDTELGWSYLLLLFSAVILGGIGSVYGGLVGGFVIGLATEMSVLFIGSRYKFAVAFVILIGLLLVRPQGIFGVKE